MGCVNGTGEHTGGGTLSRRTKIASTFSLVLLMLALALSTLSWGDSKEASAETRNNGKDKHTAENNGKDKRTIVPSEIKGHLKTKVNNGVRYSGEFKGSGSSVELSSKQSQFDGKASPRTPEIAFQGMSSLPSGSVTKANLIKVSITVNGKHIDVKENLNKGSIKLNPHNQTLTMEDLKAINGAYYNFEGTQASLLEQDAKEKRKEKWNKSRIEKYLKTHPRLDPSNPLSPQDDLLLRTLMHLAEAPVGMPLKQQTVSQPTPDEIEFEPPGEKPAAGTSSEVASTVPMFVGNEDTGFTEAACKDKENFISLELVGCRNPNDNELYIHNCWTGNRWTQHDDRRHCFGTFLRKSGPWSFNCTGRCGPGCGARWGLGIYTVDCLDHDHAVSHVGYTAKTTMDEFRWTWGDTAYGQSHLWRKCARWS